MVNKFNGSAYGRLLRDLLFCGVTVVSPLSGSAVSSIAYIHLNARGYVDACLAIMWFVSAHTQFLVLGGETRASIYKAPIYRSQDQIKPDLLPVNENKNSSRFYIHKPHLADRGHAGLHVTFISGAFSTIIIQRFNN